YDERDVVVRPSGNRRRARGRADRRLQDADRKSRHDDGVRRGRHCERSEATHGATRWIASSQALLAMTETVEGRTMRTIIYPWPTHPSTSSSSVPAPAATSPP